MQKKKNILQNLWKNQEYILYYAKIILKTRVAGSYLGFLWLWIDPLMFMLIYSFVVMFIFKSKIEHFNVFVLIGMQNDNSEVSALIWLFNFTNNLSVDDYFIMIDDNSGKMVRFIASNQNQIAENPNYQFAYSDSDLEENQKIIEVKVANYSDIRKKWQDFCQEYYSMEIINYEENADFNGGWPVWQCNFQFTTANSDAIYELPVSYLPDMIIFN